jgi:hypothetical protein
MGSGLCPTPISPTGQSGLFYLLLTIDMAELIPGGGAPGVRVTCIATARAGVKAEIRANINDQLAPPAVFRVTAPEGMSPSGNTLFRATTKTIQCNEIRHTLLIEAPR